MKTNNAITALASVMAATEMGLADVTLVATTRDGSLFVNEDVITHMVDYSMLKRKDRSPMKKVVGLSIMDGHTMMLCPYSKRWTNKRTITNNGIQTMMRQADIESTLADMMVEQGIIQRRSDFLKR